MNNRTVQVNIIDGIQLWVAQNNTDDNYYINVDAFTTCENIKEKCVKKLLRKYNVLCDVNNLVDTISDFSWSCNDKTTKLDIGLYIEANNRVYRFIVKGIPDVAEIYCIGTSQQTFFDILNLIKQHYNVPDNYVCLHKNQEIKLNNKLSLCDFVDQTNEITFMANQ